MAAALEEVARALHPLLCLALNSRRPGRRPKQEARRAIRQNDDDDDDDDDEEDVGDLAEAVEAERSRCGPLRVAESALLISSSGAVAQVITADAL